MPHHTSVCENRDMGMPWFTTKGQIGQLLFQIIAAFLVAIKVWPDMVSNRFMSLGAWILYILVALILYSIWRLISALLKPVDVRDETHVGETKVPPSPPLKTIAVD